MIVHGTYCLWLLPCYWLIKHHDCVAQHHRSSTPGTVKTILTQHLQAVMCQQKLQMISSLTVLRGWPRCVGRALCTTCTLLLWGYNTLHPLSQVAPQYEDHWKTRPSVWQHVTENIYTHRKRRQQDDDDVMICQCPQKYYTDTEPGCGPTCINRMLNTECSPVRVVQGCMVVLEEEQRCYAWRVLHCRPQNCVYGHMCTAATRGCGCCT